MENRQHREIPFNYTSADDGQVVRLMLGQDAWYRLERLRFRRRSGRLARLLMRFLGDMFVIHRNPFVYQDLVDSPARRRSFFRTMATDLDTVAEHGGTDPDLGQILEQCRHYAGSLADEIRQTDRRRRRMARALAPIVGRENLFFDPFTRVSHATDATDWRLHLPLSVVRPGAEDQVAPLLARLDQLGVGIVPRGGGTGLTGGAVPVSAQCVVVNTEKLNRIHGISHERFRGVDGAPRLAPVIRLEAGVITEQAMDYAARQGLVFATDPTSAWACTIGGNIAENAGGKTAVLWGTAIDNLLSFRIAVLGGEHLEVRRIGHPLRKIRPSDQVCFEVRSRSGQVVGRIDLTGTDIRKKGLGKDITNKALNGLPGIQKEGCDGIITSAEFILHKAYRHKATCCLEFYGEDMEEASRVICKMSEAFVNRGQETLMALEHFDQEYIRAIGYKMKAARNDPPKAVLLIDMVAHGLESLEHGRNKLAALLASYPNTCVFFAQDEVEATRYWRDRKRMGAIAARTNAFKLNEDIVLPLSALADFSQFVDQFNIEEQRYNQKLVIWQLGAYLDRAEPLEDPQWLQAKRPEAKTLLRQAMERIELAGKGRLDQETHLGALKTDLLALFQGYSRVSGEIEGIAADIRARRIVVATHMHAGDGNVHVNIPVFSNDRDMMARARETADVVMAKAVELGGVVSGEHGIGFTKFKYLDTDRLQALKTYRDRIDPHGRFNPGKLSDPQVPDLVFTPSFNLLGLEARILRYGSLETLAEKISRCVRCGRCKADCCVFFPGRNLFSHPRNKNIALGAIIEALLYDAQRRLSTRLEPLRHLKQIADHCTICHKCLPPCPVDIDTGEISILQRQILAHGRFKRPPVATRLALAYMATRSGPINTVIRRTVLGPGVELQRAGARVAAGIAGWTRAVKKPPLAYLTTPLPRLPGKPFRHGLETGNANQALVLHPRGEARATVFYFPGCGSERLYSSVARAAVYLLLRSGMRVVLPPPFLCCGFAARANAREQMHRALALRNSMVLSQIREMLGNQTLTACVVTCGTCRQSLEQMGCETLLECAITDVSRFLLTHGLTVSGDFSCLYHAPCHDSLDGQGAALLKQAGAGKVVTVPHCCGEAGTLALSRPDIAHAMFRRKAEALAGKIDPQTPQSVCVTNCPACLQGLGRQQRRTIRTIHLTEALAEMHGGQSWHKETHHLLERVEPMTF
ncbi:MAG: DUF3683 domain-containing protein [Desulfobacterales bacterium]|nr:DUF3683 domain-containing protein [Desulfobacterales bacterium]